MVFHQGRWFLAEPRRQELDAASSILASAAQSMPPLDETAAETIVVLTWSVSKMLI